MTKGRRVHSTYSTRTASETVRVPFRKWFAYNATVSFNFLLGLRPSNLGDVIAAMRTSFSHWRMNSLKVRIFAGSQPVSIYNAGRESGPDCTLGVGFTAVDVTKFTSTPSWNSATQLPLFAMGPACEGATMVVPHAELRRTTVPWLETTATGSESEAFQDAGSLYYGNICSTGSSPGYYVNVLLEGEVEFRDRVDNAVSLFLNEHKSDDSDCCVVDQADGGDRRSVCNDNQPSSGLMRVSTLERQVCDNLGPKIIGSVPHQSFFKRG